MSRDISLLKILTDKFTHVEPQFGAPSPFTHGRDLSGRLNSPLLRSAKLRTGLQETLLVRIHQPTNYRVGLAHRLSL